VWRVPHSEASLKAVVRGSNGPVVLMGPWMRPDWVLSAAPTVVAGFDGSIPGCTGLRAAGDLAAALGARVRVVEISGLPDVLYVARVYGPDTHGWDDVDELELATLSWVHWFNHDRLHGHCHDVPPAEFEQAFYAAQQADHDVVGIQ
jgi:hypothetical protein